MLKKLSVKILVLIGMVALYCFSLLSAFAVKAENYDDAQTGVTIHKNYNIATADEGKYANLLLNKNNDLSDYYKNYYSGGAIDFQSGYLYEADKAGVTSKVRLLDEYSGTFSIIGQGFYDEYVVEDAGENKVFVADYGRLSFEFTNLENPNEYFRFAFTQTGSHYLELNVYYYDKAVKGTSIYSVQKKISMSFTEKSAYMNNKNLPFRFEYVMATQTLNMRDETVTAGATHDLNALIGANLPVFENYSVDMIFENKSQKNTAKFTIFELCGQSLAGTTLVDTSAPVMLSVTASTAEKRLTAKAYDLVDGVIEDGFTFTVTDPNGNNITDSQDSARFNPNGFGDYTVSAFVTDNAGKQSAVKTVTVTIEPDRVKPQISVNGQYRRSYLKGESVTVCDFTADDDSGIKQSGYTILQGEDTLQAINGAVVLNNVGIYKIVYYAVDNFDNRQELVIELNVTELTVLQTLTIEASNSPQSIPQLSTPSGWYYVCKMYLKADTQKENAIPDENGAYIFNKVESYVLMYSVIPELETQAKFVYETELNVTDTQKPVLTLLGEYKQKYTVQDSLKIIEAEVSDNCLNPTWSVTVFYGAQQIEVRADGNALLDKTGTYEIRYTAIDVSGNESSLSVSISVEEKVVDAPETERGGGWVLALVIGGVAVLLGAGVVVGIVLVKRKRD